MGPGDKYSPILEDGQRGIDFQVPPQMSLESLEPPESPTILAHTMDVIL